MLADLLYSMQRRTWPVWKQSTDDHYLFIYNDKKLSYCRGTAQHAVSVKTMLNVAQVFLELHLNHANDLQGHPWSLETARIDKTYDASY